MILRALFVLLALLALILSGCGGGSALAPAGGSGSLSLAFTWPALTREIPTAAQSLKVTIRYPNEYAITKHVNRPPETTAAMPAKLDFFGLLTGPATLTINAYSQPDGLGNLLASGTAPLTIQPGVQSAVTVTLSGVVDFIDVHSTTGVLTIGESTQMQVTAYDAREHIVVLPPDSIEWSASPTTVATITSTGVLTAVAEGQVTVTAKLINSSLTDSQVIDVVPPAVVPTPNVAPVADAFALGETFGAIHLSWPTPPPNVVAVMVYRNSNPYAPIAVLPSEANSYLDSSKPLPTGSYLESTTTNIAIDPNSGTGLTFHQVTNYEATMDNLLNANESLTADTFSITSRRFPLTPGFQAQYHLRWLYTGAVLANARATGRGYTLYLSTLTAPSMLVTSIMPPVVIAPDGGILPTTGDFQCATTQGASEYTLQLSTDPTFPPLKSLNVSKTQVDAGIVTINQPITALITAFNLTAPTTIYWRMGARNPAEPAPVGLIDANTNGWVYSETRSFLFEIFAIFSRKP